MKVAVVGLGYVGTVTAACMASHGHDVWGVDVDEAKVSDIRAGRSPVAEPGLDDLVGAVVAGGTLHATTSAADALAGADLSLVCVGTPSTRAAAPTCPSSGARWTRSARRCGWPRPRRAGTAW